MSDNTSCSGLNYCVHGSLARSCEICELEAEVERLKQHIAEIEQPHREHLEEVEAARGVWISEEQIDKAWGKRVDGGYCLSKLGIVECQECSGSGSDRENREVDCPRCHGHGWIREEAGDATPTDDQLPNFMSPPLRLKLIGDGDAECVDLTVTNCRRLSRTQWGMGATTGALWQPVIRFHEFQVIDSGGEVITAGEVPASLQAAPGDSIDVSFEITVEFAPDSPPEQAAEGARR